MCEVETNYEFMNISFHARLNGTRPSRPTMRPHWAGQAGQVGQAGWAGRAGQAGQAGLAKQAGWSGWAVQ